MGHSLALARTYIAIYVVSPLPIPKSSALVHLMNDTSSPSELKH